MCQYCERSNCLPSCPEYDGYNPVVGRVVAVCGICGRDIYTGEKYIDDENCPICADCAAETQLDELVLLSHSKDFWEVFEQLGITVDIRN